MSSKFGLAHHRVRSLWVCSWGLMILVAAQGRADSITADPLIDFRQPVPGKPVTTFTDTDKLTLKANTTTNFTYVGTVHLTDFEFTASIVQNGKLRLSDDAFNTFFAEGPGATNQRLTVVESPGAGRHGMNKNQEFSIALDGFVAGTTVTATPSVPEPSTCLLFAIGSLVVAGRAYAKLGVTRIGRSNLTRGQKATRGSDTTN